MRHSIIWGGKGKDRVPLIYSLFMRELEKALEGVSYKRSKRISSK